MSDLKETGKGSKPADQAAENRRGGRTSRLKRTNLVDKMIKDFAASLKKGEVKVSVGDFVRLVQLREDLDEEEEPKEIRVTWVEPPEKESVNET
jgi:hypothetical protein